MKTTLFYFTGTGNGLKVARDLAQELGSTDIVNIAKIIDQTPDLSADRIGIIYPVYAFGMPLIVTRFIQKLKANQDKYFFAIVTAGGLAGDTLGQNARLLRHQGIKLSAGFVIQMPGNYTPLYGAQPLNMQNKIFRKEERRIREIAPILRAKKASRIERGNFLLNFIFSGISRLATAVMHSEDKNFWVDDKCIGCDICLRVCPVNNIKFSDKKPEWLHRCEQCFACLQWCPKEAIQYGKNTSGRKRYQNPCVQLKDILLR
jgi:ferredoxin